MHPQTDYLINKEYAPQRSPEWFAQRERFITASEAGTALGINKYESKRNYILVKSGQKPARQFDPKYCQHGIDCEDMVREWYEKEHDQVVHETGVVEHPEHDFLGASPDGVCESGRLLEIKCPSSIKRIKTEVGKIIPPTYFAQMQLQLECCDMEECDFLEYVAPQFSEDGNPHFYMKVVKRDREWFAEKLPILRDVFELVQKIRNDPTKVSLLYKNEINLDTSSVKCDITYVPEDLDDDY